MKGIRNIAIIAHVDHGKTTLVDKILHHCKLFRDNQETGDLILDYNDIERERGITILSKNVSVIYKDIKINLIDTPGHSDFGGEVERVLNMADGVLLLVDAFEGAMPQTRFVLQKALNLKLKPIVVINKIDKQNCKPDEVYESIFDLMFELDAEEWQLDFPVVYGSAKNNWMSLDWKAPSDSISPLLDTVIEHIPEPKIESGSTQMLITSLDYSSFTGRIAIGRLQRGELSANQRVSLVKRDGEISKSRIKEINTFDGLGRKKVDRIEAGDICAVVGLESFEIGDTIADFENPEALPTIAIDEPTMSMLFTINNSPFFGKEGKFVTSRHIKDRLHKELERNLAMQLEERDDSGDKFVVFGRGVLHLSVLVETMRREGYEFMVSKPQVITKEEGGKTQEPMEKVFLDIPEEKVGIITEKLSERKGRMTNLQNHGTGRVNLEFSIPSRGLIGFRSQFLTDTQGAGIMNKLFDGYAPWFGPIPQRKSGALVSDRNGKVTTYACIGMVDRGELFIGVGIDVYDGMIIGERNRDGDLNVNITREKKLTNMRASGSDNTVTLRPPKQLSLDQYIEFIAEDELVEITPENLRLRKMELDPNKRASQKKKEKFASQQ